MRVREIKARVWHPCAAAEDGSWFRACESIAPGQHYFRVDVFPGECLYLYGAGDVEARNHPESVALCSQCGPGYAATPTTAPVDEARDGFDDESSERASA